MTKVTTSTGIELDSDDMLAPSLTKYAKQKGLEGIRAFVATHPDNAQEYVLVKDQNVIYANSSAEAVACHLDMLWAVSL